MTQPTERDIPDPVAARQPRWRRNPSRKLFNRISIQSKLILMLVLCTVISAAVVGGIAYQTGRNSLRTAAINRLTEIRESQKRALEQEVNDLRNALITYTNGATVQGALRDFTAAFDQLGNAPITPEQTKAIADYYAVFAKNTEKYSGNRLDVAALLPTSNAERYLQYFYTSKLDTDELALAAEDQRDGSVWSAANAKYHSFFREIVTRFAFEDALLIDARGNVVYSTYKNVDLGSNILTGPYSGSNLHDAFVEAMSSNKAERVAMTDFEFYQPSAMAPTAWMVAPIPPGGKTDGVLALQFPITKINTIMTFDKRWGESGMGETGETILAGDDFLMRSDSRMFLEDPDRYRRLAIDAGTPPDLPDIAIRQGGTTLVQPVNPEVGKEAQKGLSGIRVANDYLGQETLQAYAPIRGPKESSIRWSIVAKVTTAEAFAPEATFTRIVVLATTAIIFAVCLLAAILARVFVRPLRRLEEGVQRISAGDFDVEIPVETRDEIGELTGLFNEMSRSLTVKETLVNEYRAQIRRLLGALMPAPLVDKVDSGSEIAARDHQNVTVVYTDIDGLDRVQAELDAGESLEIANELLRQFGSAAADFGIERVRAVRNGYLGSCGLTIPRLDNVKRAVDFTMECQRILDRFNDETRLRLSMRAGIDTGTVSSGLIGEPAVVFDLWGAAVNLAHRIKDEAPAPGIYVTDRVHQVLSETLSFEPAGTVRADGFDEPVWRVAETP